MTVTYIELNIGEDITINSKADTTGYWNAIFETGTLSVGKYSVLARQIHTDREHAQTTYSLIFASVSTSKKARPPSSLAPRFDEDEE